MLGVSEQTERTKGNWTAAIVIALMAGGLMWSSVAVFKAYAPKQFIQAVMKDEAASHQGPSKAKHKHGANKTD